MRIRNRNKTMISHNQIDNRRLFDLSKKSIQFSGLEKNNRDVQRLKIKKDSLEHQITKGQNIRKN